MIGPEVPHAALVALINDHVDVAFLMVLPVAFCNELLTAELALVVLFIRVDLDMLAEAALVPELFLALLIWAPV